MIITHLSYHGWTMADRLHRCLNARMELERKGAPSPVLIAWPRPAAVIAFFMIALLAHMGSAHAHGLLIRESEPGVLEVGYEGGYVAAEVSVVLYDADGNVVVEGVTDDEGRFEFDRSKGARVAEADDGIGHRVVYDIKSATIKQNAFFVAQDMPLALRTAIAVAVLLAIAAAGVVWTRRRAR